MLFSWPFVAHFHLIISSPRPPLFFVVQVFCGSLFVIYCCALPLFSLIVCTSNFCVLLLHITYFSMFFYCASPWSWIFVLICSIVVSFCCASLWWFCFPLMLLCFCKCVVVFFFLSIVTHCFYLHLLLRISTHHTTIVLLCFSTMIGRKLSCHILLLCITMIWLIVVSFY
jgi:hypothetical protein